MNARFAVAEKTSFLTTYIAHAGQMGLTGPRCLSPDTEDANTGYAGNGPQAMAMLRNLAVSLVYISGVTEITRTLQAIARDRNRVLGYLPL